MRADYDAHMHRACRDKAVENTKNTFVNRTNIGIIFILHMNDFLRDAFNVEIVGILELYVHNV